MIRRKKIRFVFLFFIFFVFLLDFLFFVPLVYFYVSFKNEVVDDFYVKTYVSFNQTLDASLLKKAYYIKPNISTSYQYLDYNIFIPLLIVTLNDPLPFNKYSNMIFEFLVGKLNRFEDSQIFPFTYNDKYTLIAPDLDDTALVYLFLFKKGYEKKGFSFNSSFIELFNQDSKSKLFYTFPKYANSDNMYDVGTNIHLLYYCSNINCSINKEITKALLSSQRLKDNLFRDDFYDCSFKIYRLNPFINSSDKRAFDNLRKKCYLNNPLLIRKLYIYSYDKPLETLISIWIIFLKDILGKRRFFYVYKDRIFISEKNKVLVYIFSKGFENAFILSLLWKYFKTFLIFQVLLFSIFFLIKDLYFL